MSETPQQAYISKVHLKGYKSIRDLEIDFKPGLNIIIGPNGSGKTNFLEFLDKAFHLVVDEIRNEVHGKIEFFREGDNCTLDYLVKPNKQSKGAQDVKIIMYGSENEIIFKDEYLKIGNKEIYNNTNFEYDYTGSKSIMGNITKLLFKQANEESKFVLIKYGVDKEFSDFFSNSFSVDFLNQEVHNGESMNSLWKVIGNSKFNDNQTKIIELNFDTNFLKILEEFSPIQNLKFIIDNSRINQGVLGSEEENKHEYFEVQNLIIEFLVGKQWIDWVMLSDGSKRIFFLLYMIFVNKATTILLEEPELGIHPEQLYKLMDFIKEQSKEKQIIITTHSPDVLNALGADELDRIIVTKYDSERGTTMQKLKPSQIKKARRYMESAGLFLSDYWVHSDLEAAAYETEEED